MANGVTTERSMMEVEAEAGGAALEGIGALAAVALSILGIIGVIPVYMESIATIVIGAALLAEGAAVGREYAALLGRVSSGASGAVEVGSGISAEFLIGGSAVVLGIIALVGVHPDVLVPSAVIAIGAALILTSGTATRLSALKLQAAETDSLSQGVSHAMISSSSGAEALAGIAAIVLGIIALVSVPAMANVLSLIGLLVASGALVMNGGTLSGMLFQEIGRVSRRRSDPSI